MLKRNHEMFTSGVCDGFNAPSLAWLGHLSLDDISSVDADFFNNSGLLFSNWWAGSHEDALAFADMLQRDAKESLNNLEQHYKDGAEDDYPLVAVCLWEGHESGLSMVALISNTEDFILEEIDRRGDFEESRILSSSLAYVAGDGNDNDPWTVADNIKEDGTLDVDNLIHLICEISEYEDEEDEEDETEDETE